MESPLFVIASVTRKKYDFLTIQTKPVRATDIHQPQRLDLIRRWDDCKGRLLILATGQKQGRQATDAKTGLIHLFS
jgi:hypothetical protein